MKTAFFALLALICNYASVSFSKDLAADLESLKGNFFPSVNSIKVSYRHTIFPDTEDSVPANFIQTDTVDLRTQKFMRIVSAENSSSKVKTTYITSYINGVDTTLTVSSLNGENIDIDMNDFSRKSFATSATISNQYFTPVTYIEKLYSDPFTGMSIFEILNKYRNKIKVTPIQGGKINSLAVVGPYFEYVFNRDSGSLLEARYYSNEGLEKERVLFCEYIVDAEQLLNSMNIPSKVSVKYARPNSKDGWHKESFELVDNKRFSINSLEKADIRPIAIPVGTQVTDAISKKVYEISALQTIGDSATGLIQTLDSIIQDADKKQ